MRAISVRSKIIGMFVGVAVGDALGMPAEKLTAAEIKQRFGRITGFVSPRADHKWHKHLRKGMWTDDTRLTLATAEGLMLGNGFFMPDIAKAHVAALNASTSGWGRSTKKAVEHLKKGVSWDRSALTGRGCGEGSGVVMKIGPLAAYLYLNPPEDDTDKIEMVWDFTRMTHNNGLALSASLAQVAAISHCLGKAGHSFKPSKYLAAVFDEMRNLVFGTPEEGTAFSDALAAAYCAPPNQLAGALSVVRKSPFHLLHSVPLSHAVFLHSPTKFDCVLNAIAMGGDTDTNASIVGGLFGALNGIDAIPPKFISGLRDHKKVLEVAKRFCKAFVC